MSWIYNVKISYNSLSDKEKKVIDYILENDMKIENMTLRKCADGNGVGQPTVVRALKLCGYSSWNEFKQEVIKSHGKEDYNYLKNMPENWMMPKKQMINQITMQVINDDVQMIMDMMYKLDFTSLQKLAKIIKKADMIDIYGTDNSANAATELSGKLLHMGIPARNYSDFYFQKIAAIHLNKKCVAVAFSISGDTRMAIDVLESARKCGASTVAITGNPDSPLCRHADFVFETPTNQMNIASRYISSRISQIAFVDVICATILGSDMKKYSGNLNMSIKGFEDDMV